MGFLRDFPALVPLDPRLIAERPASVALTRSIARKYKQLREE